MRDWVTARWGGMPGYFTVLVIGHAISTDASTLAITVLR